MKTMSRRRCGGAVPKRTPFGAPSSAYAAPSSPLGLLRRSRNDAQAPTELRAAVGGGEADVGPGVPGLAFEMIAIAGGELAQRRLGLRRQGEQLDGRGLGAGSRLDGRTLLHHDVGVGAARAERADAGEARHIATRPRRDRRRYPHRELVEADLGVHLAEVQVRRKLLVLQGADHLDEPGHASGGLEVADVRLDRSDEERVAGSAVSVHRVERPQLDRIAERRTGAMGFDVAHLSRSDRRRGKGAASDVLLRRRVRNRDPAAAPVLVDGGSADEREHAVVVGERVGERA